jgi:hypothetical protein
MYEIQQSAVISSNPSQMGVVMDQNGKIYSLVPIANGSWSPADDLAVS